MNAHDVTVPTRGEVLVRVRYAECDPMGVAHHGSYPAWLEMGRTELLRDARDAEGNRLTYAVLEKMGVFLVVAKLSLSYKRPARYDDVVRVSTEVVGSSRVKLRHRYVLTLAEPGGHAASEGGITPADDPRVGDVLAEAESLLACVDTRGKPSEMPGWLVGLESVE